MAELNSEDRALLQSIEHTDRAISSDRIGKSRSLRTVEQTQKLMSDRDTIVPVPSQLQDEFWRENVQGLGGEVVLTPRTAGMNSAIDDPDTSGRTTARKGSPRSPRTPRSGPGSTLTMRHSIADLRESGKLETKGTGSLQTLSSWESAKLIWQDWAYGLWGGKLHSSNHMNAAHWSG
mmetsp:Transcript_36712/g.57373  ORF Transcript_36712/g.57373 Transcript_36712/m.57373 type:complete len:177 (-) Transcript_36712:232-762(-)|eukprot:CAMPEP_0184298864 /NCGR_PEP_ID=MMETSP1049-20130417/9589_1 /TAXON_ID=77928 /ORGANISM="Proteomonas sulcata, Strain CCMP704" /LENGTH=176 /DNA_ID=CAMNT_0026609125 /DNA_START=227 /DNA_END=757 /DNA_ORIENTATION=+